MMRTVPKQISKASLASSSARGKLTGSVPEADTIDHLARVEREATGPRLKRRHVLARRRHCEARRE